MKLFRNNVLYVQKKDLMYLLNLNMRMPQDLKENLKRIKLTEDNQNEFVRFTIEKEIEYYNNIPWIIDYDESKNLTEEEILEMGDIISSERKYLSNKLDKEEDRNKKIAYLEDIKALSLEMNALKEIYLLKRKHINIRIPIVDPVRKK